MNKARRFLVVGDNHGDMADRESVSALLDFKKDWKPEIIVHLGDNWDFRNKCNDAVMYASFDGVNDDVELVPNEPNEAMSRRTHCKKVWLRAVAGGTAPVTLRAEASSDC